MHRIDTMERDAQMYRAYKENIPIPAIAVKFGVSESTVGNGIRRAIQGTFRLSADEDRAMVSDQIDALMFKLRRLLAEPQYMVSASGKMVVNPMTGEPVIDQSHQRQTIIAISKLIEQKTKLLGLNMPVRHRVEITDKMDDEIERLATELALHGAGSPVEPEAPVGAAGGGDSDDGDRTADATS
jgi:hypothetical protein